MIALLLLGLLTTPALDGVQERRLPNGLLVLLLEDRSTPLVSTGVMYRVGARDEAPGITGVAHYVEHMAFRDLRGYPGSEGTETITRIGGRWTGYTWIEQTWYAETVPSNSLTRVLDIQAERMGAALFLPEAFERERTSVIAELHSYEDPHSLLYDAVLAASFEIHPYRHNTIGWLSDVEGLTRDEAFGFYQRYYGPGNAVLVVVGDFETEAAWAAIESRFGPLSRGPQPALRRSREPQQRGPRRVSVRRPGPNGEVLIAWRAPPLDHPDFAAMVVFDALLAGGKGFEFGDAYPVPGNTPLGLAVVDSGAAQAASSDWQPSLDPYVYLLRADVADDGDLAAAERALRGAVEAAATKRWSDAQIARALRQIERSAALDLDSLTGRAHQLAFFEISGGYQHRLALPRRLAAVTRADLARFAANWLDADCETVGWFVPTADPASRQPGPPAERLPAEPPRETRSDLAQTAPLAPAAPMTRSLANGLQVELAPLPRAGMVSVAARIDAGAASAAPGLAALAVEHLSSIAAAPGAPPLSWRLLDDPASARNARWLELEASVLPDELDTLLGDLAARLRAPAPSGERFRETRASASSRAAVADATAELRLWAEALRALWPAAAPAAAPPWGPREALERATPTALAAFLASRVTPARTHVSIAGALDADAALAAIEERFGSWAGSAGEPPPTPAPRGPEVWSERHLDFPGRSRNEIVVVWPGDRSQPFDDAATRVLLYLLGETYYAGRLGHALVEPGLVYAVWTTLEEDGLPGFLAVHTAAAPEQTAEVLGRIRAVLEETARGGFTPEELEEARAYLRGKAARSQDGSRNTARSGLRSLAPVDTLTLEELDDTARRLFANGRPVALVAGPGH